MGWVVDKVPDDKDAGGKRRVRVDLMNHHTHRFVQAFSCQQIFCDKSYHEKELGDQQTGNDWKLFPGIKGKVGRFLTPLQNKSVLLDSSQNQAKVADNENDDS